MNDHIGIAAAAAPVSSERVAEFSVVLDWSDHSSEISYFSHQTGRSIARSTPIVFGA